MKTLVKDLHLPMAGMHNVPECPGELWPWPTNSASRTPT